MKDLFTSFKDNCGFGLLASIDNRPSHKNLEDAIMLYLELMHRREPLLQMARVGDWLWATVILWPLIFLGKKGPEKRCCSFPKQFCWWFWLFPRWEIWGFWRVSCMAKLLGGFSPGPCLVVARSLYILFFVPPLFTWSGFFNGGLRLNGGFFSSVVL